MFDVLPQHFYQSGVVNNHSKSEPVHPGEFTPKKASNADGKMESDWVKRLR